MYEKMTFRDLKKITNQDQKKMDCKSWVKLVGEVLNVINKTAEKMVHYQT